MWNGAVKLVKGVEVTTDSDGFDQETENFLEGVPANFTDTTRNDETIANQNGYTADKNIEILACNYNGEKILYDEGTGDRYEIKRTYHKDKSLNIVLTCERRERSG